MIRFILSAALLFALTAPAFAQESTCYIFNRIPVTGVDEIAKQLSDPKVRLEDKSCAVSRLGELSRELVNNKNVAPSSIYNPILGSLAPQTQTADHHILREAACQALARFSDLPESERLIQPLGKVVKEDSHEEVRLACARALSRFYKDAAGATTELVAALNSELERGPQADNVTVATAIIRSLGSLRDRRSFVPLMRVIQSRFPTSTKREAQRALENIKWD